MEGSTEASTQTGVSTQTGEASTSTEQTTGANTEQVSGDNVNLYEAKRDYSEAATSQGGKMDRPVYRTSPYQQLDTTNEDQTVQSFNPAVTPATPATEVKAEETKVTLSTEQQGALNTYLDALNTMLDTYEQITPQMAQQVVSDMKQANTIGTQIEKNNEGITQAKEELQKGGLGDDEKLHFIQKVAKYEVDNQSLTSQLNFLRDKLEQKDVELETLKSDPFKQSMNENDKNFLGAKKNYESNKENPYYEKLYVEGLLSQIENVIGESLQPAVNAIYQRRAYNFKPNATSGFNLPQTQATTEDAKKNAIREALNTIGIQ